MSATRRDVTISVKGVPFIVTVLMATDGRPNQTPRRWRVRIAGTKHDIDELLACDVLSEIDRRIKGGIENLTNDEESGPIFDIPTRTIREGKERLGGLKPDPRTPRPDFIPHGQGGGQS